MRLRGAGAALPQGFVGVLPVRGDLLVECVHSLIDIGCLCDQGLSLRSWTNCLNERCFFFLFSLSYIERSLKCVLFPFPLLVFVGTVPSPLAFPPASSLTQTSLVHILELYSFFSPYSSGIMILCILSHYTLSHSQDTKVEALGKKFQCRENTLIHTRC